MNKKLDWNDYEIVLQVADAGSLSKAAQLAGSSHPTMFRKINSVEEKLGVRIFERFRTGYRTTPAGEELLSTARSIAALATETERRLSGQDLRPSGTVRLATTDTLLHGLLAPQIERFRQLEPAITLDIAVSNEITNLSLRESDVAIRPTASPDDHLVGRKLGRIRQAVYAHRSFGFRKSPQPPWKAMPWIGPSPSMAYGQLHAWMQNADCNEACVCRMDSVLGMYAAIKSGVGVAILPSYLAEADTDLEQIGDFIDDVSVDLWLLTHPDLRRTARIRAVLAHFGTCGSSL